MDHVQSFWPPAPAVTHQGVPVVVLGQEHVSEADLRLFCAVLRALALGESEPTNRQIIDEMLQSLGGYSGIKLAGLHVFSLAFYKRIVTDDVGDSGECCVGCF